MLLLLIQLAFYKNLGGFTSVIEGKFNEAGRDPAQRQAEWPAILIWRTR